MKNRLILIIALAAGTAYACPGDSDYYSPNPGDPDFNPLHPDYDYDGDGIDNWEDDDIDGDGIPNCADLDPTTRPPTGNFEDGVPVWVDCPPWQPGCLDISERGTCLGMDPSCDTDLDGIPNSDDDDDDGDGWDDVNDPDHPNYDPTHPQSDPDCDGLKNFEDDDDDDDGIPDDEDENETCPDEGDPDPPDDEPPEPPDAPDPPDEPILPEPPAPPDNPQPPDDPDPPTEPEPPGPDPDPIPEPPSDDECCEAICTRLDAVIMWLDLNTSYQDLILDELHKFRADFAQQMGRFINGETGRLDTIAEHVAYANTLTLEDREYQFDQTWYLEQIYGLLYAQNNDEPTPEPGEYEELETISTDTEDLVGATTDNQGMITEYGHDFSLPDISKNDDTDTPPTIEIQYQFTGMLAGFPEIDIDVDLTPFEPIRNMVHAALYLLITTQAIFIVWRELEKK